VTLLDRSSRRPLFCLEHLSACCVLACAVAYYAPFSFVGFGGHGARRAGLVGADESVFRRKMVRDMTVVEDKEMRDRGLQ
jgi:hypothetical protein